MIESQYYERKIKYLDLMENGERVGGAGFVKTEVKGMEINLLLSVKGLHPTDTYERDVMLQAGDGEFAVGRIALKEGQGEFKYHMVMDHSKLQGIRIALGGIREIRCKWQVEKRASGIKKNIEQEGIAQDNSEQNKETSGDNAEEADAEKQRRTKQSREIQLIPWDEIKVVEESLERVEKMMSDPAESGTWKAAEKTAESVAAEHTVSKRDKGEIGESVEKVTEGEASESTLAKETTSRERTAERTAGYKMSEKSIGSRTTESKVQRQSTVGQAAESGRERESTRSQAVEKSGRTGGNPVRDGGRGWNMENRVLPRDAERRTEKAAGKKLSGSSLGQGKKPVRLMEDKWKQIWAIYPHINPFQDEREYLSISPADFVLLRDEAYRAANNSFLLHGYYNYDHLILTRIEKRGEISYYIGVPGNYYEREKQVAIMFGFESFECGTEPAQTGDFGYYMMRTQL